MTRNDPFAAAVCLLALVQPAFAQTSAQPPTSNQAAPILNPNSPIGQPEPTEPVQPPTPPPPPVDTVTLDTENDMVGIAQETAKSNGLQARVMWIDAGANVGNLGSPEKIHAVVDQIKAAGFNMIVLDVKPIVGDTVYPSKYAPKLTEWRGNTAPKELDVLRAVLDDGHAAGLKIYANMSTFGEGHKLVKRGLAYDRPEWQTTMYLTDRSVSNNGAVIPLSGIDEMPQGDRAVAAVVKKVGWLTKAQPGLTVAVLNFDARVMGVYDGATLDIAPQTIPSGGFALIGKGEAGAWLTTNAIPDQILQLHADPKFVPITEDNSGAQVYTVFVDPNNDEVRRHETDILREIVTNYDVDGVVFDDRMRFAGLNADFSPATQAAFEKYLGHKVAWPDDVYRDSPFPSNPRVLGPNYQDWLVWRAGVITGWLKEAAGMVRTIRPATQVSVYVGSWYGSYEDKGSNWSAADFNGPWEWDTPAYQKTGYADVLNWLTTGCYYGYPTIADAQLARNRDPNVSRGQSVEAAAQLSNRVVNDAAWTYAGIYALTYQDHAANFKKAIQAAVGASQGVMVFDLSQIIQYGWWDEISDAFGGGVTPLPPNTVPGLLEVVRARHASDVASGKPRAPIPAYQGVDDIGL